MLAGTEVKVVGEVATGAAAVKFALENEVDVVLLDIRMPDGDGLTALGRIKLDKPDLPILILSTFDNPTYVARAVALGASGYLLKGCTRDELLAGIRTAAAGESAWTRDELRRVTGALATPRLTADVEVPLDPARERSPPPVGLRADEQGNRQHAAHQLRDGQGARAAHPAQDRRFRPHASRRLGRPQGTGLRSAAAVLGGTAPWLVPPYKCLGCCRAVA